MQDDRQMDLALWRYGIISPLLHRDANDLQLWEMLSVVSQSSYIHPHDGRYVTLSAEAIRKWLYRFNHGGLGALCDKERSDKGTHDVPAAIAEEMIELRQIHPRWTLALMLRELVERQLWDETRPSRSTLYRFARNNNLMRDPHLATIEVVRPFEFDKFGQMWIGDFMHGPKLYEGKKKHKSYLHVIIDDCTRYVVSARFYSTESTRSLIIELMIAIRRHGIPYRLYTDNGSAYNSRHLKIVCANLSMRQPHTPPGRPQRRSKVERFNADFPIMRSCFPSTSARCTTMQHGTPHNQRPSKNESKRSEGRYFPGFVNGVLSLSSARCFIVRSAST